MENKQGPPAKEYNYFIYLAACLAVPPLMRLVAFRRDAEVPFDTGDFAFILTLLFAFCSLAWMVGRKYDLRYVARCALGGSAAVLPGTIKQFGGTLSSEPLLNAIFFVTFGAVFLGGIVLAISYPFQLLFFKLQSKD